MPHARYLASPPNRGKGTLIDLCTKSAIPIYTCRGSELPSGWKRAK